MSRGGPFEPHKAAEEADEEGDEADLWFLPGPPADEDIPPGATPRPKAPPLFGVEPWQAAQATLAVELAELAVLFGALDERLRTGPQGWGLRLALREVSDLTWWTGDRLGAMKIGLWVGLRIGSADDTERALARAGWAVRRLSGGAAPAEGLEEFLDRRIAKPSPGEPAQAIDDPVSDLADILETGMALHPVTQAARLFHGWHALGPDGSGPLEAAVLAARHGASMSRWRHPGALFLPLAQTGADALRGQGDPSAKLAAWLRGTERATFAALLHLEQVAAWRMRATAAVADLSGRTPRALLDLFEAWPHVSATFAEKRSGASRAAVQRNLAELERRDVIREITGQERYRVWAAVLH